MVMLVEKRRPTLSPLPKFLPPLPVGLPKVIEDGRADRGGELGDDTDYGGDREQTVVGEYYI